MLREKARVQGRVFGSDGERVEVWTFRLHAAKHDKIVDFGAYGMRMGWWIFGGSERSASGGIGAEESARQGERAARGVRGKGSGRGREQTFFHWL